MALEAFDWPSVGGADHDPLPLGTANQRLKKLSRFLQFVPRFGILTGERNVRDSSYPWGDLRRFGIRIRDFADPEPTDAEMTRNVQGMADALGEAILTRRSLLLPTGRIWYNDKILEITQSVRVIGQGPHHTILSPSAGYSDYAIRLNHVFRNGGDDDLISEEDFSLTRAGVVLQDFAISGNRNHDARGIQAYKAVDNAAFVGLRLNFLRGKAMELGVTSDNGRGFMRESVFHRCRIQNSGSDTEAFLHIGSGTEAASGGADGTNQLSFVSCQFVYNYAGGLIESPNDKVTRRITFTDQMWHGRGQASFDGLWPDGMGAWPLLTVRGRVIEVGLRNTRMNSSHKIGSDIYPLIQLEADDTDTYYPINSLFDISMQAAIGEGVRVKKADYCVFSGYSAPSVITGGPELTVEADAVPSKLVWGVIPQTASNKVVDATCDGQVFVPAYSLASLASDSGVPAALLTGVKTVTSALSPYAVTDADEIIFVNADGGAVTVNLPSAASAYNATLSIARRLEVVRVGTTDTNAVTIAADGADTISGSSSLTLDYRGRSLMVQPNGSTQWIASFARTVSAVALTSPLSNRSTDYTVVGTDHDRVIRVDATGGAVAITIASTLPVGWRCTISKIDAGANTVTVSGGSCTINGAGSKVLSAQYDSVTLFHVSGNTFDILAEV